MFMLQFGCYGNGDGQCEEGGGILLYFSKDRLYENRKALSVTILKLPNTSSF